MYLNIKDNISTGLFLTLSTFLVVACAPNGSDSVVIPQAKVDLLADPDFKDFTMFLDPKKSIAESRDEIWRIEEGMLHVIGKGFGYLRTNQRYRDYHLVLEFKWGEKTWASRVDKARDCGVLVHAYGKDGSLLGAWIPSIEGQLIEGGSGDILVLRGEKPDGTHFETRLTAEVTSDRDGEPVWTQGGESQVFPREGKIAQRINWRDRDPDWKDVNGFRGSKDIEKPLGEWSRLELIADGDTIKILLNGELVNEGWDASPSEGYVCLQSELAECWIRRFELWPLGGFRE